MRYFVKTEHGTEYAISGTSVREMRGAIVGVCPAQPQLYEELIIIQSPRGQGDIARFEAGKVVRLWYAQEMQ